MLLKIQGGGLRHSLSGGRMSSPPSIHPCLPNPHSSLEILIIGLESKKGDNKTKQKLRRLKGPMSAISSDPPCKDDNVRFTILYPLNKTLYKTTQMPFYVYLEKNEYFMSKEGFKNSSVNIYFLRLLINKS